MQDQLADFGTYLRSQGNPEASFVFAGVPIEELARVDEDLFSVTMSMPHMGQVFAMTIDFGRPELLQFLMAMPRELAVQLVQLFEKPFVQPQVINLPIQVVVTIETRLGEEASNDEESYIPLIATSIQPVQ